MGRKIGTTCMILGAALVLAALSLFLWNRREAQQAGDASEEILLQIMDALETEETASAEGEEETSNDYSSYQQTAEESVIEDTEMTEVEINGYYYIGYLSIPALDLELPVMSTWSDAQLKISPCRYAGSTKTDDLVIAGHNYIQHFAYLKRLSAGDAVYFTDMDGAVFAYEVAEIEILSPTAVEEMTAGEYPLTLFTCTYGSQSRVTVRCERAT